MGNLTDSALPQTGFPPWKTSMNSLKKGITCFSSSLPHFFGKTTPKDIMGELKSSKKLFCGVVPQDPVLGMAWGKQCCSPRGAAADPTPSVAETRDADDSTSACCGYQCGSQHRPRLLLGRAQPHLTHLKRTL